MRSIDNTQPEDRFLKVAERLSAEAWKAVCNNVRRHLPIWSRLGITTRETAERIQLLNYQLPPTSFPFVIISAYADIPAETTWDVAFDPLKPQSKESTIAVFKFGVFWERIIQPRLEDGHHQIAVIDFPNGIPELLNSLPVDAYRQTYDFIGLCDSKDFVSIQQYFQNRNSKRNNT